MLDVERVASDDEGGVEQRQGAKLGGDGEVDGIGQGASENLCFLTA